MDQGKCHQPPVIDHPCIKVDPQNLDETDRKKPFISPISLFILPSKEWEFLLR